MNTNTKTTHIVFLTILNLIIFGCIIYASWKLYKESMNFTPTPYPYSIVIITLKRAIDRHAHLHKTMKYPFSLYYGVDGKLLDAETKSQHSIPGRISPAQVGIFLSHLTLWRSLQNKTTPTLILEDDAVIIKDLNIVNILPVLDDFDIIYYGSINNRKGKKITEYLYTSVNPICMHGYLISQRGIHKLLQFFEGYKIMYDFDNILVDNLVKTGILKTYSVFPQIIQQNNKLPAISDRFFHPS
jgi:GR25 family glycosyltransferase involved in LPS biosynthesis